MAKNEANSNISANRVSCFLSWIVATLGNSIHQKQRRQGVHNESFHFIDGNWGLPFCQERVPRSFVAADETLIF